MKNITKKIALICSFVFVFAATILFTGCNKDLEDLQIYTGFKTEYVVGESLDLTNGKLIYTDNDGKETIISITESMISSFSTATAGTREMVITYNNKTLLYSYTVVADVQVGDLYYLTPSIFTTSSNMYDYIYIKTTEVFSFGASTKSPENITDSELQTNATFTRSLVGGKVVYTYNQNNASGTAVYTLTVNNATSISVSIVGTQTYSPISLSGTFTKVVR